MISVSGIIFKILVFCSSIYMFYWVSTNSLQCDVCIDTVKFISYEMSNYNKTIIDISELAKDLCYDIGGKFIANECNYILNNMENIIDWLQNSETPNQICSTLKLCNKI